MKKIVLMLGIVICFAYESSAETWNCGPATDGVYSDSVKCTYDETTKTFTIAGEGPMGDYSYVQEGDSATTPWYGKDIVHAVIEGNVTSIGARTFKRARNLQDITGTENITSVGIGAFIYSSLKSIDLPNVQNLGQWAFFNNSSLEFAGIPEGVAFGTEVFKGSKISNCQNTGDCGNCGDKVIQSGVGCVNNCPAGHTSYYGLCTRTRYTLPEADSATSDDNENMIEWIFE